MPKKSSKASPQKRAAQTRARNKAKRAAAARKGWRTRRANQKKSGKRSGYMVFFRYLAHSPGNGYILAILIKPRKRLSDDDVMSLAFDLVKRGHFDYQDPIDPDSDTSSDYQWIQSNQDIVEKSNKRIKKGAARLYGFYRD